MGCNQKRAVMGWAISHSKHVERSLSLLVLIGIGQIVVQRTLILKASGRERRISQPYSVHGFSDKITRLP